MIFGDKQFRDVKVMTAANVAARANKAALAAGEVQAFNVSGNALATAGERFILIANVGGELVKSDIIDPANVISSTTTEFAAAANKVSEVTIPASPTVGDSYEARLLLRDYGNKSAWDYGHVYGHYVVQTGDTATNVAAGLAAALNASLAKVETAKVVMSNSSADLIATGQNHDFKIFQFDGKPADFVLSLIGPDGVAPIAETITTERADGKGEGTDIVSLEYFSKKVKGDSYAASEISYNESLVASTSTDYDVIEITYYSERQIAPGDKQRKVLTIPVDSSLTAADVNAQLINPLQTIGLGLVDLT